MKDASTRMVIRGIRALSLLALAIAAAIHGQAAAKPAQHFDIPAQDASDALNVFSKQSGLRLLFSFDAVKGVHTKAIVGTYSPEEVLQKLLAGTGLRYEVTADDVVLIRSADAAIYESAASEGAGSVDIRLAQTGASNPVSGAERQGEGKDGDTAGTMDEAENGPSQSFRDAAEVGNSKGIPEILVKGTKTLNMDIQRTREDTQPYVILDREMIRNSGAINLESFLKQRLPMNTAGWSIDMYPSASSTGSRSLINLRGFGASQTLVLIDGRRAVGPTSGGSTGDVDLNGIPLAAIERIEVLPATASGIYGGKATGGVVNVVLRHDYAGAEVKLKYENTFDTDAGIRGVDINTGFKLGGKTQVMLAGSLTDGNLMSYRDRDFLEAGRRRVMENNPSSIVGATNPPLGATTNIRSNTGSPLILKPAYGSTPLNSAITFVPKGYAGVASDGGAGLVANAGQFDLGLADSAQPGGGGRFRLMIPPKVQSVAATLRHELSPRLQTFVDLSYADNVAEYMANGSTMNFLIPTSSPSNPFAQDVQVTVPNNTQDGVLKIENASHRAVGGLIVKLGAGWQAEADYAWSRGRYRATSPLNRIGTVGAAAITSGQLNVFRDTIAFPLTFSAAQLNGGPINLSYNPADSVLRDATVRVAGPLKVLPMGPLYVSGLVEDRRELVKDYTRQSGTSIALIPERSQKAQSGYVEVRLPLVDEKSIRRGLHELELQVAGRYERFSTNGVTNAIDLSGGGTPAAVRQATNEVDSADFTFGMKYKPVPDIALRASYGTGFLPPNVNQILPNQSAPNGSAVDDPRRNNQRTTVTEISGGNPNLKPEESVSVSAGVILTPSWVPGFRLSVDYIATEKTDEIRSHPQGRQGIVNDEALFSGRVVRNTDPSTFGTFGVGPIIQIDTTLLNIAKVEMEAIDFQADYRLETGSIGSIDFYAMASWLRHLKTQTLGGQPVIENAGIAGDTTNLNTPVSWRINGGFVWTAGQWNVGWNARYYDSYLAANPAASNAAVVYANQGGTHVASQIYHDLTVNYGFDGLTGGVMKAVLDDTDIQFGLKNVFDRRPPFDVYDSRLYVSPLGDIRGRSYTLSLTRRF